ncbi:hypothetical protein C1646_816780 [Rhizophagus diaphanus]|nr:hypothetical protein C1646_816780 [Rhizophagus diaphanus] [Rhizophagus sp. MUCL 43196]
MSKKTGHKEVARRRRASHELVSTLIDRQSTENPELRDCFWPELASCIKPVLEPVNE